MREASRVHTYSRAYAFLTCYMLKTVQRRTRDAFLLVLLVPVILGTLTIWLERKSESDLKWVAHTQEVLRSVNRIVGRAYQAESDQRGYLISKDEVYLERYHSHAAEERSELVRFGALTADNAVQQRHASELEQLWSVRAQHMEEVLALARKGNGGTSSRITGLMRAGRDLMDAMNLVASQMSAEEMRLLRVRTEIQRRTEAQTAVLFALAVVINVGLLYWAYSLIKNYGSARDLAEQEILRANSALERRVHERTEELQTANESLLRSNEDLTRFAYVASHDLQEPLRTVGSYAGLLARRYEGKLDSQADKYITFIVSGAKRMQHLVQDLLTYSRTGTQRLTFGRVELNAVLETVRQDLRLMLAEGGGQVVAESLPVIIGDEAKLGLVLQNLISNGLKFRDQERTPIIRVSVHKQDADWIVSVADNGIGFDPQYAERIFIIFQRLHQVGEYAGTGIGLAICKRIIEGHGGRIWASSVPGSGSTFCFSIPTQLNVTAVQPEGTSPNAIEVGRG